ncbi:hypothetical protein BESB_084270 [Besnoitia besnoiti]|uniref:Uncharacterized protein n=1 Tax=Besnoitia besnoiti TaxID=94643 RepID=A0A2A9M410_BESBE|nr:hypothetical protein BESB_084270 [Besnoitia besnoiti]PFH33228.1 hypothetical protein BESB_084270 [Besnoitia besnoiti]
MLASLWLPKPLLKAFLAVVLLFSVGLSDFQLSNGVVSALRPDHLRHRRALQQNATLEGADERIIEAADDISAHVSPSFVALSSKSDSDDDEDGSSGASEASAADEKEGKGEDSAEESKENGQEEGSHTENEDDGEAGKPSAGTHHGAAAAKATEEKDEKSGSSESKTHPHEKDVENDAAEEKSQHEGKGSGDGHKKEKEEGEHGGEEAKHEDAEDKSGDESGTETNGEGGKHEDEKKEEEKSEHGDKKEEAKPESADREKLVARLTKLLSDSGGTTLLGRLETVLTEHEKEEERKASEEAKKKEEEKEKDKAASLKEKLEEAEKAAEEETQKEAPARDLLLTQQLNALWMLPFLHDKKRTETCLSGFEKLTAQSRIKCRDPACMKLEQDKKCAFLDVHSIDRASHTDEQNMGIHIGFDPTCRDATQLGNQLLELLQHPVKQHELEQRLESVGTGETMQPLTNHLDLVCEGSDPAAYPTCNAVSQALRNVPHLGPKNLPSMVVLADISDLPNTVGLFRIAVIFEGRVPLVDANGDLVDRRGVKLGDSAAHEVLSKIHNLQR